MRLSDVVGASDLAIFAQIGLVLFCFAFAGVLVYTFMRRNREVFDRARQLPLEDSGSPVDDSPVDDSPADDSPADGAPAAEGGSEGIR